ncbi:MAG TPA: flagellar motor protein MotA [Hyphomicrobiaceae bacterium]|nr:flagellar motor protein MotA [Hyphomicrobiaceae bacterium]
MARARPTELASRRLHRTLNTPGPFLRGMLVFLLIVGLCAAVLYQKVQQAFWENPFLNGLILAVLAIGILRAFGQVIRLYPEIRWVNAFRIADPGLAIEHKPVLLAPMATMLRDRTGQLSLSTSSMRSIMDSIGGRLDEARDTGRYLVGLLVFLGLLGTFWGLLDTIHSVGNTINSLDTKGSDSVMMFEELKTGLSGPLRGMGTAFSASLMGLGGSLILGFLDLQASHAHNRFYNELEEWLSGITELTPGGEHQGEVGQQLFGVLFEVQRTIADLSDRIQMIGSANGAGADSLRDVGRGLQEVVGQMRAEQKIVREWVDEQATRQAEMATALRDLAGRAPSRRGS